MIRKATEQDLPRIGQIYEELLDHEAATTSYTNWQKGLYPTVDYAAGALAAGTLYVGEDERGALYGTVILNQTQPEEYASISWNYEAAPEEIMVIHTLCIRPSCAGRGYGKEFVAFSEQHAREHGWSVIRIDTYEGNLPALAFYPPLGYEYAGTTRFHFHNVIWENLKCFDKKL